MPIGISVEIILRGKLNLSFGKKVAPNSDINWINFFILRFLKELSPVIIISMLGVVDKIPKSNLDKVPLFKQFMIVFFFANKEPRPFP